MRIVVSVCVGLAVLMLAGIASAAQGQGSKSVKGEFVKIDGVEIVLKDATGAEVKVKTDASTTVKIEGVASKLADLKAGQKVNTTVKNDVATKVTVPKPKTPKTPKTPQK